MTGQDELMNVKLDANELRMLCEKHLVPAEIEREPLYVQWIGHVAWARRLEKFFRLLWGASVGSLPKDVL